MKEVRAKHFRPDNWDAASKSATLPSAKRAGRAGGAGGSALRLSVFVSVLLLACTAVQAAGMAWGAKAGAAEWCRRLKDNDKALASLLVMRTRAMATADWVDFCGALSDNKELKELKASSHKLEAPALAAFRHAVYRCISRTAICIQSESFHGKECAHDLSQ